VDSSFVDLDILITKIREPRFKTYFLEAVRSYKAGALRSALTAAWIAVAYDLLLKYRELTAASDPAATAFTTDWDNAEAHNDIRKLLSLEGSIIDHAWQTTQIITGIARTHLNRLFSNDADLFEPSAELVRLHLVNAVGLVLSQEPLQGNAILTQFHIDVKSSGFPDDQTRLADYVEQRYLRRIRPGQIKNFGVVLAKALLQNVPADLDPFYDRVALSLHTTRDRAPSCWPDISGSIVRLLDNLDPALRLRGIAFLAAFPSFWPQIAQATQTALLQSAQNIQIGTLTEFRCLRSVQLPAFAPHLQTLISALPEDKLGEALQVVILAEMWPAALDLYHASGSWRHSETRFKALVQPFVSARLLDSAKAADLLHAVGDNGQNWDAAETPRLLINAVSSLQQQQLPARQARDDFYNVMRGHHRITNYAGLWVDLGRDGWVPPP